MDLYNARDKFAANMKAFRPNTEQHNLYAGLWHLTKGLITIQGELDEIKRRR
jgi:hypothetical protein